MRAARKIVVALACGLPALIVAPAQANYLASLRGPRDDGPNKIVLLNSFGGYISDFVPSGVGGLHGPTGLAIGPDGNLYVTNATLGANNIVKFDGQTGAPLGTFGSGLNGPTGLRYNPLDGNFYVANFGNFGGNTVSKISAAGAALGNFGTGHSLPTSVAIDGTGNVYVSEFGLGAVNKYNASGSLLSSGSVSAAGGVSFSPSGKLLAASVVPDQILQWDGTNANPPTLYQSIDENFVAQQIDAPPPVNMFVGGQFYTDATHSLVYSTGLGLIFRYTDGIPTPTAAANFYSLDPFNGVAVGDIIFTNAGPRLGDFNRDSQVSADDIPAMLEALTDLTTYKAKHQNMTDNELLAVGDFDNSGSFTNVDIQGLLDLLINQSTGGSATPVPEPPAFVLAGMGLALLIGQMLRKTCRAARSPPSSNGHLTVSRV